MKLTTDIVTFKRASGFRTTEGHPQHDRPQAINVHPNTSSSLVIRKSNHGSRLHVYVKCRGIFHSLFFRASQVRSDTRKFDQPGGWRA
ncbi:hypothetical protein EUGRSUZ_B01455 [Eucalyptus grandis]|uniref:Uncharacterized protein n=2 Tax=Eucalyptus grandis TaxID=71139 RepID=A0ACC3LS74_EUCGR|nr:hypothetical protein EUGRSUZ_B01455 [Eucalyptus grandis]